MAQYVLHVLQERTKFWKEILHVRHAELAFFPKTLHVQLQTHASSVSQARHQTSLLPPPARPVTKANIRQCPRLLYVPAVKAANGLIFLVQHQLLLANGAALASFREMKALIQQICAWSVPLERRNHGHHK